MGEVSDEPTKRWEEMTDGSRDDARMFAGKLAEAFLPELTPPRRTFFADVSLMGHRALGLCRVEESSLGGQDVLRATTLTAETERVHWIRASSIWCATEVPEAEALERAEEARARREKVAAEKALRDQERAAKIEQARALRVGAYLLVSTTESGNVELRALHEGAQGFSEGVAEALRAHQPDVREALRVAKVDFYSTSPLYGEGGAVVGFCLHAGDRASAIVRAFGSLGFDRIERTGPEMDQDEGDEDEPEEIVF